VRKLGSAATSAPALAEALVKYFYNELVLDKAGTKACSLVRLFRTRAYSELSAHQKTFADSSLAAQFCFPTTKCLTLEASAGDKPEWNSVVSSRGHQAIPLPSEELVRQMPMISQLISDLGLRVSDVLEPPADLFIGRAEEDYNIFLVPDAVGSAIIPAQDEFVIPNKIRSVLGYGGMMPAGDMFAVILFSKVKILRDTADMFRCIALATNLAVMRFDAEPTVNPKPPKLRILKPREGSG
jgi:hypothetical protein